jgi:hypothetical protein
MEPANHRAKKKLRIEEDNANTGNDPETLKASRSEFGEIHPCSLSRFKRE